MATKLTRWFSCQQREYPVRNGWYNTRIRGKRGVGKGRRFWNGLNWSWPCGVKTPDAEAIKRMRSITNYPIGSIEWQGRCEEPMDVDWAAEPTGKSVYPDTD